jgi:hypothetical protein
MMSLQPFDALAQRLLVAERQIAIDRAEIAAMRRDLSGHRRSRWMSTLFATIGVVAAITMVRSPDPQAQKSQAEGPLVVKAPFTVVDSANYPIMRVQERSNGGQPRGVLVFNSTNFGVVTLQVREAGSGAVTISDGGGAIIVEAGMTTAGAGIVRAGPASAPTAPGVPPSSIMGVKK